MEPILLVFVYALLTALATGLGALPFFFVKKVPKRWIGLGTAIAAGAMIGASLLLIDGGIYHSLPATTVGVGLGALFVWATRALMNRFPKLTPADFATAKGQKMLLIVLVMTVHSLAEGIGIGVAFGNGAEFGLLVALAIAIQNIPEGLAISLVLVPRGTRVWKAMWWSVFSSLPQLFAVVAFLFVEHFTGLLPAGLGFAAGAMLWMVWQELIPDAKPRITTRALWLVTIFSAMFVMALDEVL